MNYKVIAPKTTIDEVNFNRYSLGYVLDDINEDIKKLNGFDKLFKLKKETKWLYKKKAFFTSAHNKLDYIGDDLGYIDEAICVIKELTSNQYLYISIDEYGIEKLYIGDLSNGILECQTLMPKFIDYGVTSFKETSIVDFTGIDIEFQNTMLQINDWMDYVNGKKMNPISNCFFVSPQDISKWREYQE